MTGAAACCTPTPLFWNQLLFFLGGLSRTLGVKSRSETKYFFVTKAWCKKLSCNGV